MGFTYSKRPPDLDGMWIAFPACVRIVTANANFNFGDINIMGSLANMSHDWQTQTGEFVKFLKESLTKHTEVTMGYFFFYHEITENSPCMQTLAPPTQSTLPLSGKVKAGS